MQINTALLTDDEKEFLEELKEYLGIAKTKMEFIDVIGCENPMINEFIMSRWEGDIHQVEFELDILNLLVNRRASRLLNLCHTGK